MSKAPGLQNPFAFAVSRERFESPSTERVQPLLSNLSAKSFKSLSVILCNQSLGKQKAWQVPKTEEGMAGTVNGLRRILKKARRVSRGQLMQGLRNMSKELAF